MSNQSEDIQAFGSDTRPPMLDMTYFESWQQRIRLYCKGKDHGEYILQSIDEGPFKIGWCRDKIGLGKLVSLNCQAIHQLVRNMYQGEIVDTRARGSCECWLSLSISILFSLACNSCCFRAKKLEKSHDPLALVAHTGLSSRNTLSYYVTHPTSVVDYDDEYQEDDIQTNSEDPLTSAMLLLSQAITQNFSNLTNNRLRTSSNTRNYAVIQGDQVNIHSRNSGNAGRNNRRAYVQEEVIEGANETANVQRTLQNSSSGNTLTVQCYNCSGKRNYARNCPKPRVWDSKYFMEQMLLAKQDVAGVILTDEQNDFLFADASKMEEIKDLSANICLIAKIQPTNHSSDVGPSYDYAFISEVQSSSINENEKKMYQTHTIIINSTIVDDQIDSNIIFDTPNGNVNSGSVEKDTHFPDLCALEQLARNAYQEVEKQ
nr:Gag-Pol polyprotein [Tanacetum cinerariifolium]